MVQLNPDFWDATSKIEREIILRGALHSARVNRPIGTVDYELRTPTRKRDIPAEDCSQTKERIKARWAAAEQAAMPKLRQIRPIRGA